MRKLAFLSQQTEYWGLQDELEDIFYCDLFSNSRNSLRSKHDCTLICARGGFLFLEMPKIHTLIQEFWRKSDVRESVYDDFMEILGFKMGSL